MKLFNRSITKVNNEEIYRPVSYTGRNQKYDINLVP